MLIHFCYHRIRVKGPDKVADDMDAVEPETVDQVYNISIDVDTIVFTNSISHAATSLD